MPRTKRTRSLASSVDEPPFDPLDYENIGKMIILQLLEKPLLRFDDLKTVAGAGVYALYYVGGFEHYSDLVPLDGREPERPIYVGKAVPQGGRKGSRGSMTGLAKRSALATRLSMHRLKISRVTNLEVDDFRLRFLALTPVWIALGENAMIRAFKPLWNVAIDGFGNNALGKGRGDQSPSAWDHLHQRKQSRQGGPAMESQYDEQIGRVKSYFANPGQSAIQSGLANQEPLEQMQ